MKTLLVSSLMVVSFFLNAQKTPRAFISSLPVANTDACSASKSQYEAFANTLSQIKNELDSLIAIQKEEFETYMESRKKNIESNLIDQSGLTQQQIDKLPKERDLTDKEIKDLANSSMKQKYNMSMEDVQKLKGMSEAQRKAWAQQQVSKQMDDAKKNGKPANNSGTQKSMDLITLLKEQTELTQALAANEQKMQTQYQKIMDDADKDKKNVEIEIAPLEEALSKVNLGEGSTEADAAKAKSLTKRIHSRWVVYCNKHTPLLLEFITRSKAQTITDIPNYIRAQEIQIQLTSLQTHVKLENKMPDLLAFESVKKLITYLDAYQFWPGELKE